MGLVVVVAAADLGASVLLGIALVLLLLSEISFFVKFVNCDPSSDPKCVDRKCDVLT